MLIPVLFFGNIHEFKEVIILLFILYSVVMAISLLYIRRSTTEEKYTVIDGLKIIFFNNDYLFFVSNADTGFIEEIIEHLYLVIQVNGRDSRNELIINFSDSSINIKEAVGSNIIGGNVEGDVRNG